MRRKFNGFDILVAVVIVVGLIFLARKALHHTGTLVPQQTVVFTVTSVPTVNSAIVANQLVRGGSVTVSASGSFVQLGTLQATAIRPLITSVSNGHGKLVVATDPLEKQIVMTIAAKAAVSGKKVTINGNPFLVGQGLLMQEGGAQISGYITSEQVR